ncbi:uncharacterized protein LOC129755708 [Uranotaenia lowii]|uniref:uncharacterized protein LOC129755708 n=1 Tax=Uranotaenia lowii TaxID=190385 RepID=UPI00247A54F1|nr:uncharacterized protein LOC129755708 [Uranotaenia lowii]XP_055608299.1 uncharacterized protein LOC129755708 [Uranotaenia lowii]XP_055608300.1 uncharacterized protein LOC129755708 [Uranotaenia lowii]
MSNPQVQTNDELEIAEAQNSLCDLLYDYAAKAVTTRIGQFVYRRVESALSIVEKTARWSLPQPAPSSESSKGPDDSTEDPGKMNISAPPLIRPLPWLLFIPALIYMRLIRSALSLMALMMGWRPILPEHVVSWLQNKRRKLRALKYRGQKLDRIQRAERKAAKPNADDPQTTWLSKITLPWRMVIYLKAYGQVPSSVVSSFRQTTNI